MTVVLDASAVIALLREESGSDIVEEMIETAEGSGVSAGYLSAVNLTEILQRLAGVELPALIGGPEPAIVTVPFNAEHARTAAGMLEATTPAGLSLADRACLALARVMSLPAVTADRVWSEVDVGVEVVQIR